MVRSFQRINRFTIIWVGLTFLVYSMLGGCEYFPESTFKLADESRLPKWITLPPGLTRADVSITMNYYVKPWGRYASFILQDTKMQELKRVYGKVKCKEPFELPNPPQGSEHGYPAYEEITVQDMTEIIEHRKMEPVVYVTDNPAVWKHFSANGCS